MSFLGQENKELIWTLLQDNNTFDGLTNDKFPFVQKKFEDILGHINIEYGNNGLLEKNKIAIEMSIDMINKEKKGIDKKIQMIYKAQDLEDERKSKLNEEYNQQKQELDSMINPSKPKEINFNDNIKDDEDRPIGNDMDRLINERLASRERELEIPQVSEEAKKWINNDNKINNNIEKIEEEKKEERKEPKKVSFNDDNVNNIFDKLKKKTIEKEVIEEIDLKKEYNLLLSKKNQMLLLFKEIEVSLNKLLEYKV